MMKRLLLIIAILLLSVSAEAATYYVDDCANNGTGLADQCAVSGGAAGAFQSPQSCLDAMVAGDTCLIKDGTYVTSNAGGGDARIDGGFHFTSSGTNGSRITLKNYPGHNPVLVNCTSRVAACGHPTLTSDGNSYITIDGLTITGGMSLFGSGDQADTPGLIVRNNKCQGGWQPEGDGNWACFFLSDWGGAQFDHNYAHDPDIPASGNDSSSSCFKWYHMTSSISEYNTCIDWETSAAFGTQAGGMDDKAKTQHNIHRYNHIKNTNTCFRFNNQLEGLDLQVYGNLCETPSFVQVRMITGIDGAVIRNNTFYGGCVGVFSDGPGGGSVPVENVQFRDNILVLPDTCGENGNYVNYETSNYLIATTDYNRFQSGKSYKISASVSNSSLAAHRTSSGRDANSSETACTFTNAGAGDFRLASGGCLTSSSVGGKVGYEGVTSCVGYLCGSITVTVGCCD